MYIAIDLKNNVANGYTDAKMAAESINISYNTLWRHLEDKNYYSKGDFRIYKGEYYKSERGNPHFGR